jgi:hypothetical protein
MQEKIRSIVLLLQKMIAENLTSKKNLLHNVSSLSFSVGYLNNQYEKSSTLTNYPNNVR